MPVRRKEFDSLLDKLFKHTLIVMIVAELAPAAASMIDGIIIAHFFDQYAIASYGLANPYTYLLKMIGAFIAIGTLVVYSRYAAVGNYGKANETFTTSATILTVVSILGTALIFLFSDQIALFLGAATDPAHLQHNTSDYLKGLSLGLFANLGTTFLIPLMNIDGDKKRIPIAINTMMAVNLAGDLIVALFFGGNLFGIALVTSISYLCSFLILLLHFRKGSSIRLTRFGNFKDIAINGLPSAMNRLLSTIRSYAVNIIVLSFGGAGTLAAITLVQGNIYTIPLCLPLAVGTTTLSIASVLYEEHDKRGLCQMFRSALKVATGPCLIIAVVIFLFAPQIVRLYGANEIAESTILALRLSILGLPFSCINVFFVYYFQSTSKTKLSFYMSIASELVLLVLWLLVFGKLFGEVGLFISYPIWNVTSNFFILIMAAVKCGHFPRKLEDFLFLDKDFSVDESRIIDVGITSLEEVIEFSKKGWEFCSENGVDERKSYMLKLAIEEMAGNIFIHGMDDGKPHFVDMRIVVLEDSVVLRLRDNCRPFNPKEIAELTEDPRHNVGIRLVSKTSRKMTYANLHELNQLTIEI